MGKSPSETEDAIKDEIGDYYVRVASIGLAGEKLSRIACIINEKTRAAGRTGLGAVPKAGVTVEIEALPALRCMSHIGESKGATGKDFTANPIERNSTWAT